MATTENQSPNPGAPGGPNVVVVGGGYGGVGVAKALDAETNVVLIEPKESFVHNIAALRALVEPDFLPKIFLPYENLLARGHVERDRAVTVGAHRVVVESGKEFAADYIVLASGSTYPFPAKTDARDTHDAIELYRAAYDKLRQARRVLLVGAGPVGIELAGEIHSKWPDKHITLLDFAPDVLGERFRPDLRDELRAQLEEIGVELVLGEGLRGLPPTVAGELNEFTVTTETDRKIAADIWFQCFGVSPESDYLDDELRPARRPDGFVTVGPSLQVANHENVFAIGDVSTADAKMAGMAGMQAQLTAQNILRLVNGDHDLAPYEPYGAAIVVPIGPERGSGQLPGQDELISREMVADLKGRDLMIGRFSETFGLPAESANENS